MKLDEWQVQRLLRDHFEFYEDLRQKRRRPKSAAQRQFQDVAWGKAEPKTEHEHAYVAYLKKHGIGAFASIKDKPHIDHVMADHPVGHRPVDGSIGEKWDNAWRAHRGDKEFW